MLSEQASNMRVTQALAAACPDAVLGGKFDRQELTLEVHPERIVEVCRFLKQDRYERLAAVTCVDWYPMEPRYEAVYHVQSIARGERLRLKAKLSGVAPVIDSVYPVWKSADWYEREVYDLFGVIFRHHPNLERILMPADWEGHPLRKDYPVDGYKYSYSNG